jgi:hypothetical protein
MLSARDRHSFEQDGYLVLRSLFDAADVAQMSAWIDGYAAQPPAPGGVMLYFEDARASPGRRILSRIEKFADPGQPFARMLGDHPLHRAVEALLDDAAVLFKEKVNLKLAGGGGFEPHQDIQAGWDDYAPYFLSVAVAIDDSNPGNGCLEVAPGQHRQGWLGERWKPLTSQQTAAMRFESVPLAPGDAVVFDCFLPHRSGPNGTDRPRRNLYLTYNRARDGDHREHYFADKRRSFPPDNEREPGKTYVYRV